MIMAIAVERLLAVWKPIRYRNGVLRRSMRAHALTFILPPIFISVLINIPKFFEMELHHHYITNEDGDKELLWDYKITDLREDPDYIFYYIHWFRNLSTGVIPIIFLITVNAAILFMLPSNSKRNISIKFKNKKEQNDEGNDNSDERNIKDIIELNRICIIDENRDDITAKIKKKSTNLQRNMKNRSKFAIFLFHFLANPLLIDSTKNSLNHWLKLNIFYCLLESIL